MPDVAARVCHIATQSYRILEPVDDGADVNDVSILDWGGITACKINVDHVAFGVIVDSFHTQSRVGRHVGQSAGQSDHLAEALLSSQLIDSRGGYAAQYGHLRPHLGDEDHVARLQPDVFGLVSVQQQVV